MRLIATKELRYAGATRRPGAEFEASDKDGKLLKLIGKAADAPAEKAGPVKLAEPDPDLVAAVKAGEMTTAQLREEHDMAPVEAAEPDPTPRRGRYRRRDMRAG